MQSAMKPTWNGGRTFWRRHFWESLWKWPERCRKFKSGEWRAIRGDWVFNPVTIPSDVKEVRDCTFLPREGSDKAMLTLKGSDLLIRDCRFFGNPHVNSDKWQEPEVAE